MTDKKGTGKSGKQPNKGCKRIVVGAVVLVAVTVTAAAGAAVAITRLIG